VELATLYLLDPFSLEAVSHANCPLILVKYFLILTVLILLFPQLKSIVLAYSIDFSLIVEV
jgi:hypothetical protein